MLSGDEMFIVLKLTSGEQVMAVLSAEDEEYVQLVSPMCIRTIPVLQTGKEHITAAPLCPFTDDTTYILAKKDIIYLKKLHQAFVSHYKKIVTEYEEMTTFQPADESHKDWDDASMSPEEVKKRIEMLKDLAREETEERYQIFVQGDDTVH